MGLEVERKFLVADESWRAAVTSATHIVQGYVAQTDTATVRIRVTGERAFLTIKGASVGIARSEFEYEVPVADALAMLEELAQGPVIDKVRHAKNIQLADFQYLQAQVKALGLPGLMPKCLRKPSPTMCGALPRMLPTPRLTLGSRK